MKASVDMWRRYGKQRAHTATHLLHAALQEYFPMTKQEWSFVGEDELRFDFSADALLSNEDLATITQKINTHIAQAVPVTQNIMNYDEAIASGAKAFFADTYGEEVRVITIGDKMSVELCGWNHVTNTADIGAFVIDSQEAVAAGIKRIHAYTWPRVVEKLQDYETILQTLVKTTALKQATQLPEKIEKVLKEYEESQSTIKQLKQDIVEMIGKYTPELFQSPINLNSLRKIYSVLTMQDIFLFLENAEQYKTMKRIAYSDNEDGTSVVTIYDPVEKQAKETAKKMGIQWGGTDKKVTWKLQTHFIVSQ